MKCHQLNKPKVIRKQDFTLYVSIILHSAFIKLNTVTPKIDYRDDLANLLTIFVEKIKSIYKG